MFTFSSFCLHILGGRTFFDLVFRSLGKRFSTWPWEMWSIPSHRTKSRAFRTDFTALSERMSRRYAPRLVWAHYGVSQRYRFWTAIETIVHRSPIFGSVSNLNEEMYPPPFFWSWFVFVRRMRKMWRNKRQFRCRTTTLSNRCGSSSQAPSERSRWKFHRYGRRCPQPDAHFSFVLTLLRPYYSLSFFFFKIKSSIFFIIFIAGQLAWYWGPRRDQAQIPPVRGMAVEVRGEIPAPRHSATAGYFTVWPTGLLKNLDGTGPGHRKWHQFPRNKRYEDTLQSLRPSMLFNGLIDWLTEYEDMLQSLRTLKIDASWGKTEQTRPTSAYLWA